MTRDVRREVGERLVEELPNLDYGPYLCGCWPEDVQEHEGVVWAYTRALGFHDPLVQHGDPSPRDGELAVHYLLSDNGGAGAFL